MTDKYAVVGNPVAHSLSPKIHAAFGDQTGEDVSYGKILAPLDDFKATVLKFRDEGGKGLNVTLPFKLEAWRLAGRNVSVRANAARAVNTLKFNGNAAYGDNTDGIGLIRDLKDNLRSSLERSRILLVGAGGAARGVLLPLLLEQPDRLVIVNRTVSKAEELKRLPDELTSGDWDRLIAEHRQVAGFRGLEKAATRIDSCGYDGLVGDRFDFVINATSLGLRDECPPLPGGIFAPRALAYDMMYGKEPTPFLKFAQAHGAARGADGLGMLVEQAAESFFIWRRGVRPVTAPVIALLKAQGKQ